LIASGPSRFDYSLPQNQYCGHREIFELVSAHFSLLKKKSGAGAGITVRRIILTARRDYDLHADGAVVGRIFAMTAFAKTWRWE
jgi:hypothetical protein